MTADLQQQWQDRIDKDFPNGFMLGRDFDRPEASPVGVAWVRVTALAGLDPRVTVYPAGGDRPTWDGLVITDYTELQTSPVRLVRVKFKGENRPQLWTAIRRKEPLAAKLTPWREWLQARARGEHKEIPQ